MRIIHLSDPHLSASNIEELRISYMVRLLEFLEKINSQKRIDLVVISGDIIDKSGISLSSMTEFSGQNPYHIFENEFLIPIYTKFPSLKGKIVFCAGNHDIESKNINEITEAGLEQILTSSEKVNDFIFKYQKDSSQLNLQRLQKFSEFEKKIHQDSIKNGDYIYTDFESMFLQKYNDKLVGISIINDSWRCTVKNVENNIIGSNQFKRSLKYFKEVETDFNIVVLHHPLETLTKFEREKIENILHYQNFQIIFLGHEHNKRVRESNYGNGNKIVELMGRSAFDKPHEKESNYQCGFSITDIDFDKSSINCQFVKYYKNDNSFKDDLEDGEAIKTFYFIDENIMNKVNMEKENFLVNVDIKKFINNSDNE